MKRIFLLFEVFPGSFSQFLKNHITLFTWTLPERSYDADAKLTRWEIGYIFEYSKCPDCERRRLSTLADNGQKGHKKCTYRRCGQEFMLDDSLQKGARIGKSRREELMKKSEAVSAY